VTVNLGWACVCAGIYSCRARAQVNGTKQLVPSMIVRTLLTLSAHPIITGHDTENMGNHLVGIQAMRARTHGATRDFVRSTFEVDFDA